MWITLYFNWTLLGKVDLTHRMCSANKRTHGTPFSIDKYPKVLMIWRTAHWGGDNTTNQCQNPQYLTSPANPLGNPIKFRGGLKNTIKYCGDICTCHGLWIMTIIITMMIMANAMVVMVIWEAPPSLVFDDNDGDDPPCLPWACIACQQASGRN